MLVLLAMTISMASCSDDDDDEPEPTQASIVGTWVKQESDYIEVMMFDESGFFGCAWQEWNGSQTYSGEEYGSYSVNGNTLRLTYDDGYTDVYTFKMPDNNTLYLYEEGDSEYDVYTRYEE